MLSDLNDTRCRWGRDVGGWGGKVCVLWLRVSEVYCFRV
jgi:hypothetical protein